MRCLALAKRARYLKETEQGVHEMFVDVGDEIFQDGVEEGREQGIKQERSDAIARLVKDGTLSLEKIASIFEMSVEEVRNCARGQIPIGA